VLNPNEPSVYISGGNVHVRNIVISDPAVVRTIEQSDDPVAEFQRIASIGARVGMIGETTAGAIDLADSVERFTTTVGDTVGHAVEDLAAAASDLLDGEEGQLTKALSGFKHEIETVLGDSFDPDSKKSIVGKFESMLEGAATEQTKRLNRALDPHDPDSLVGRLRDDVVRTVKEETAAVAKEVVDLREVVTTNAAAAAATKVTFDKTVLKGFAFEDLLHELINEQAIRHGDIACQVGKEAGALGTHVGDEVVGLNPEDTFGAAVNVAWEAKAKRISIPKALDEAGAAMTNRVASAALVVFSPPCAPIKTSFAQYGDKAIVVLDPDDPDERVIQLAYLWSRWVARRKLSDGGAAIDVAAIESLVAGVIRTMDHATQVRTCHTKAKNSIDAAGTHLDTLTHEVDTAMSELRAEIDKSE
jgi:hypothetical protein